MTSAPRRGFLALALIALSACSGGDSSDIGPARPEAACQPVSTSPFTLPEAGSHVVEGTELSYDAAPPAAGVHWNTYPSAKDMKNKYAVADRPAVPHLVHVQEHGYSVLWYDETIAADEDAMKDLDAIADEYPVGKYLVVVPWTAADGAAFPDGTHVALTHWAGVEKADYTSVWEYCGAPSGEVVHEFTEKYPKSDSPEPNVA